jgi:hypothetical protein
MEADSEGPFFLGAGPLAAVLLGMALIPLREVTTASNLTFAFLALIIIVAEVGGRWAAVATAISSALSLNFFLTQPYLRLTIHSRDDIIAFAGLAVCGLIAASFGSRGKWMRSFATARKELGLFHATACQLELSGPPVTRLGQVLAEMKAALPLSAIVVRDRQGNVLAASAGSSSKPVPQAVLDLDTLLPPESRSSGVPRKGLPLPVEGSRVALVAANAQVGWLDFWGNGVRASASTRRALSDSARLIAALVASSGASSRTGGS